MLTLVLKPEFDRMRNTVSDWKYHQLLNARGEYMKSRALHGYPLSEIYLIEKESTPTAVLMLDNNSVFGYGHISPLTKYFDVA